MWLEPRQGLSSSRILALASQAGVHPSFSPDIQGLEISASEVTWSTWEFLLVHPEIQVQPAGYYTTASRKWSSGPTFLVFTWCNQSLSFAKSQYPFFGIYLYCNQQLVCLLPLSYELPVRKECVFLLPPSPAPGTDLAYMRCCRLYVGWIINDALRRFTHLILGNYYLPILAMFFWASVMYQTITNIISLNCFLEIGIILPPFSPQLYMLKKFRLKRKSWKNSTINTRTPFN